MSRKYLIAVLAIIGFVATIGAVIRSNGGSRAVAVSARSLPKLRRWHWSHRSQHGQYRNRDARPHRKCPARDQSPSFNGNQPNLLNDFPIAPRPILRLPRRVHWSGNGNIQTSTYIG